ncbi:MAG TPA: DMT family transporter [Patescibacteria group bacterium]
MSWILFAIIGYLFLALTGIIDKLLLSNFIRNTSVYVLYISLLGLFALILIPFGFSLPATNILIASLIAGFLFLVALAFFFYALQVEEASRVIPLAGGLVPLFVFIISYFFIGERLGVYQLIAFLCLVLGSVIITYEKKDPGQKIRRGYEITVLASFLFGLSFVLTKYVFNAESFINGFIWMRLGGILIIPFLVWKAANRHDIFGNIRNVQGRILALFIGAQAIGGLGFLSQNYAISLSSVTLVNALQGVQYVFVFILAALVTISFPKRFREKITGFTLIQKIIALILIALGLYFITL